MTDTVSAQNYDENERRRIGIICGVVGVCLNIILFIFKFLCGLVSGAVSITADAFNNLSDAGSSIVTIFGFKLSGHKPDLEHPYGHGRFEYISGLIVGFIIVLMGFELLKSSVSKIANPTDIEFSHLIVIILIAAIAVKLLMFTYNTIFSKKISSTALAATATDSISDVVATGAVLATTLISHETGLKLDGVCGLLVSLFILYQGIMTVKATIGPLLGQAPSPELTKKIEDIVLRDEHKDMGIIGMHDLVVHDYGPGRGFISLHAEVPASGDVMELHDLVDNIEHDLRNELKMHAVIHMDPVLDDDDETMRMRAIVESVLLSLETTANKRRLSSKPNASRWKLSFHDFRVVSGPTHTSLIFDVVLPFDFDMTDEEASAYIETEIRKVNPTYYCVIDIDKG